MYVSFTHLIFPFLCLALFAFVSLFSFCLLFVSSSSFHFLISLFLFFSLQLFGHKPPDGDKEPSISFINIQTLMMMVKYVMAALKVKNKIKAKPF